MTINNHTSSHLLKKHSSEILTLDSTVFKELKEKYDNINQSIIQYKFENDFYKQIFSQMNNSEILQYKLVIDHYKNLIIIINISYWLIILVLILYILSL